MFRFKGDVIKQLETIYGIKFKAKYKEELKDRTLFFVKNLIPKYTVDDYFKTLSNIKTFLTIEDNEPHTLSKLFFDVYSEELFNSFNPLWYNTNIKPEEKIIYSPKQIDSITNDFICEEVRKMNKPFIRLILFSSKHYKKVENVIYSNKLYLKIEKNISKELTSILDSFFLLSPNPPAEFFDKVNIFFENIDSSYITSKHVVTFLNFNSIYFREEWNDRYNRDFHLLKEIENILIKIYCLNSILLRLRNKLVLEAL